MTRLPLSDLDLIDRVSIYVTVALLTVLMLISIAAVFNLRSHVQLLRSEKQIREARRENVGGK